MGESMKKFLKGGFILLLLCGLIILFIYIGSEFLKGSSVYAKGGASTTSDVQLMARAING